MTVRYVATRRARFDFEAARQGSPVLPEGVSFMVVPSDAGPIAIGEFPHAENACTCPAAIFILDGNKFFSDPWCSRAVGHDGPHVAHVRAGMPVVAWTDDPRLVSVSQGSADTGSGS